MPTFLSDLWLDGLRTALGAAERAEPAPGETTVDVVVLAAPSGDRRVRLVLDDRVTAVGGDPLGEASASLTLPYALAVDVARGAVGLGVLAMQGRCKTAGDHRVVLRCLRATATPSYRAIREALDSLTEYPEPPEPAAAPPRRRARSR